MTAFYNEIDPYAAAWLRNLISAGHIAPGIVDERSICDIEPADLLGFTQVHFFAGIGGWSLAARLAGWPDDRPLWTGSCPCQPFSVAGKQGGQEDARHLWPEMFRLIRARNPIVIMGEQVAAAVGKSWLDGVHSDLEGIGYATGAAVVPACAVNAPHRRDRLWFVAHCQDQRRSHWNGGSLQGAVEREWETVESKRCSCRSTLADGAGIDDRRRLAESTDRCEPEFGVSDFQGTLADGHQLGACQGWEQRSGQLGGIGSDPSACTLGNGNGAGLPLLPCKPGEPRSEQSAAIGTGRSAFWAGSELVTGHDGKARRVKPGIRLLAHGVPARVGKLRAFGNAIVPQVAAEIIGAYLDCEPAAAPVLAPLPY